MTRSVSCFAGLLLLAGCDSEKDSGPSMGSNDAAMQAVADAGPDASGEQTGGEDAAASGLGTAIDPGGCMGTDLARGQSIKIDLEHDGMTRQYNLYVPEGVDDTAATPLVVNWHGLGSNADQEEAYVGDAVAEERGWIVAYPNGLGDAGGQSFNGGVCCSALGTPPHTADDVGFGRAVVMDVASQLCIDRRRVYSTGMSNGGFMSEHNACEAADLYAAVAPVSAISMGRSDCTPARPIPLLAFNGTNDGLVSYTGAQAQVAAWVERNGCTGEPERTDYGDSYCETWNSCDADVEVSACTITGMEHCWPGNPLVLPGYCATGGLDDIDATEMIFDFFERFSLPAP